MCPRHICCAIFFALVASFGANASAAPLIDGLGGPVGYGSDYLPANDDGSSSEIPFTATFADGLMFFGGPYHSIWVNNNGNVTFSGPVYNYTPVPFPVAARPMIAPYWGDVDTRGGGYPENNGVFWAFREDQMIVTWHNVGYYFYHDDLKMDFQLIITEVSECGLGDFDVEFRYNRCEWTTGDASGGSGGLGGTPAQAGFDAGNEVDFVEIEGSRTAEILNLCTTSNVGEPGVWRFGVRDGLVECPGTGEACDTELPGICGAGITQCREDGLDCIQVFAAATEVCDGLDNDCSGQIDDGKLCGSAETCVWGDCLPQCFDTGCPYGEVCTEEGVCIETECVGIECSEGQRCVGGACVDACEGIVCPYERECLVGRCVNICDMITCGEAEICTGGLCVRQCPCQPCAETEVCTAEGLCVAAECDTLTCEDGFYCEDGTCHDVCEGAVCPAGSHCEDGDCVVDDPPEPEPEPDAGVPPDDDMDAGVMTDAEVDAGSTTVDDMDADSTMDDDMDAGVALDAEVDAEVTLGDEVDADSTTDDVARLPRDADLNSGGGDGDDGSAVGCDCRVSSPRASPAWLLAIGVIALLRLRRNRREQ